MEVPNAWSSSPYDAVCQKCECGSDGNPVDCSLQYFCDLGLGPLCARYKNVTDQCCPLCGKPRPIYLKTQGAQSRVTCKVANYIIRVKRSHDIENLRQLFYICRTSGWK